MKDAIVVENISKRFRVGPDRATDSLREAIANLFKRRRPAPTEVADGAPSAEFWSLRNVSFTVSCGDTLGIVGGNGAGKSSLLKILAQIIEPTSGRAVLRGRIGSLLEVGTGFHRDLTGKENVYLSGALLGMKRAEISRRLDEIVAFSETARFLDTPVKYYSSGMYVRLAFAVAAHLDTEILLVDEVLSVGDMAFQKRCLAKMGDARNQGRTVLFVSHNMAAVRTLCRQAILFSGGRLVRHGAASDIAEFYLRTNDEGARPATGGVSIDRDRLASPSADGFRFRDIEVVNPIRPEIGPRTGDPLVFRLHYETTHDLQSPAFLVGVWDTLGTELIRLNSAGISGYDLYPLHRKGVVTLEFDSLPLVGGEYRIDVGYRREGIPWQVQILGVVRLQVQPHDVYGGRALTQDDCRIVLPHKWLHEAAPDPAGLVSETES